jgi:glutamate 5-kinase
MDALTDTADLLAGAKRLVIKIGSALLVDGAKGALRDDWLRGVALDIAEARGRGADVLVVSSGSIALGRHVLKLGKKVLSLEEAQAAAAVGQIRLAQAFQEALAPHGLIAAQVLVTLEDTRDRRRYLNGRATLKMLLSLGAVPIINENDTVATDEIRFGDNDRLAARVALMAGADVLVLLSDVDGLYDGDPRAGAATRFDRVTEITPEIEAMAKETGGEHSKGGMRTKILAAKTAMQGGCAMAITRGDVDRPLTALANGAPCTWFQSAATPLLARKQWIASMRPEGRLLVDAGAASALRSGKSLLPAGVRAVEGAFERGDPVAIVSMTGDSLGAALVGYNAEDARAIAGRKSAEIEAILGYAGRAAMAHRDDMVIWGAK